MQLIKNNPQLLYKKILMKKHKQILMLKDMNGISNLFLKHQFKVIQEGLKIIIGDIFIKIKIKFKNNMLIPNQFSGKYWLY